MVKIMKNCFSCRYWKRDSKDRYTTRNTCSNYKFSRCVFTDNMLEPVKTTEDFRCMFYKGG
jgi:hypothetical protein